MKAKNVTPQRRVEPEPFKRESEDNEFAGKNPIVDPVSELFKSVHDFTGPVIANWTDTFLETRINGARKKLYVERYFLSLKIALDRFYTKEQYTGGFVETKRKLLNDNGIRYMVLTPAVSFSQAYDEAQAQRV